MTTFYIVRHGETLFNKKRFIQGWVDSPLTKLGIEQAGKAKERLSHIHFDVAFSSTQERAWDTANIIVDGKMKVEQRKGFKECYFGEIEAMPIDQYITGPVKIGFSKYGGENFDDLALRYLKEMDSISKQYDGNVLIVGHGRAIHSLLCYLDREIEKNDQPISKIIPNCSITIIEFDGNYTICDIGK